MKKKAEALSQKLSERTASDVTVTPGESNVLIVEREEATIGCMNFNASDFTGKTLKIDEEKVKDNVHLLIINIDAAGADSVTLPQISLLNPGGFYNGEVVEWTKGNVIVNVIDSTKSDKLFNGTVITVKGDFQASIFAPDADIIVDASVNGQVIGDIVKINTELHRDSITFTNEIPSVGGLRVAKTMDGSSAITGDYRFKLEGLEYEGHQAPMPAQTTGNTKTMKAEADGLVTFGFLNFPEAEFVAGVRDYRYKVSEVIPDGATDIGDGYKLSGDVAYDANEYIIEVHTKRTSSGGIGIAGYTVYKADGTTKITEMDYDSGKTGVVTFENKTVSNEVKVVLKATKSFNSDEWPANGFTFRLEKKSFDKGDGPQTTGLDYGMDPPQWKIDQNKYAMELTATKNNPTVQWGELAFSAPGTYEYTIKEIKPDDADEAITYDTEEHKVVVTVKAVGDKKIATVTYDGNKSLTINNSIEKPVGKLVIKKSFDGLNVTDEEKAGGLTFEVKTPDGKWLDKDGKVSDTAVTLTLADFTKDATSGEYVKTFENVAAGKYTVKETNTTIAGYKFDSEASSTEAEATVSKTAEGVAEIKDVYEKNAPETGKLVITKTVGGGVTEEELEKAALKFEVKTPDGKWLDKDGKVSDTKVELTLGEEDGFTTTDGGKTWTKTFKDVATGEYTVTETNSLIDGYTLKKDGTNTEATAEVKDGGKATAELTDEYEKDEKPVAKKTGDLIITKTIEGKVTREEIEKAGIRFEIRTSDGKWLDKDGNVSEEKVELTLDEEDGFTPTADGKTWTKVLRNVPVGTYTVTETYSIIDGYEVTVVKKSSTAEVKEGEEAKAELAGVYEKDKGNAGDSKDKKDDKKPSKGVNTGDDAPFAAWLTLMLTALAGLAASVFKRRSDRK